VSADADGTRTQRPDRIRISSCCRSNRETKGVKGTRDLLCGEAVGQQRGDAAVVRLDIERTQVDEAIHHIVGGALQVDSIRHVGRIMGAVAF
jgi:hypothetical protein